MKSPHILLALLLGVVAAPVAGQSLFLDVNGDGRSDGSDVLNAGVTSVDVYLDTSHSMDGAPVPCAKSEHPDQPEQITINSYTFILSWEPVGTGSLTYGAWTDNMGFAIGVGGTQKGRDFWTGYAAPFYLAPGKHKLGTLGVTVTGTPVLQFLASTPIDNTAMTSFGSACLGSDYDNTMKLGSDFLDARGTSPSDDAPRTVWRAIQAISR
ncbi:MAG TPA: hypothetical protein VK123_08470 [Candidatus Limnocylindrales bacterium]|nr:hypothetical protein [Candidatus Limnocylindrales bacterium]